tara:strand:- start:368 stop:787 length:420 start_codon:yes stop_codon:yes gene_type:complete
MGQHNSFGKDIDLLAEAYGAMLGGAHVVQGVGIAAQQAADQLADEDGEDKTGHDSDRELLATVEKKHTAGKALIDKAHQELASPSGLSAHTRDSLARDDYGYGGEDEEGKIWSQEDSYEQNLDKDAEAEGGYKPGHPAN